MLLVWPMLQNINSYWCKKIRTFYNCEVRKWQHTELNAIIVNGFPHATRKPSRCMNFIFLAFFFSWCEKGNNISRYEEWIFLQLNRGVSLPKWNLKFSTWGKAIKTTRTPRWQTKRLGHQRLLNLCLKLTVPMAKGKRAFDTVNFK